jgi:hypothetical protein
MLLKIIHIILNVKNFVEIPLGSPPQPWRTSGRHAPAASNLDAVTLARGTPHQDTKAACSPGDSLKRKDLGTGNLQACDGVYAM